MKDMTIEEERVWLKGLLVSCPFREAEDDCPAKDLRELSLDEKMRAVDGMNDGMVHNLIAHHQKCLKRRESYH